MRQGGGPTATGPATTPGPVGVPHRGPGEEDRRGELPGGLSADQLAARQLGDRTRLPSLELAIEKYRGAGNCDSGYSCVYEHTLSWRDATTPVPPEVNPRQVFDRLFADNPDDPEAAARNELRASVLDSVLEDAKDLNRKLGGSDKQKLDQYLSGVRELEKRPPRAEPLGPATVPDDVSRPVGVPADLTEHIRLMCDLMVLAFQTDSTRICAFMLGREGASRSTAWSGSTRATTRSRTT